MWGNIPLIITCFFVVILSVGFGLVIGYVLGANAANIKNED